MCVTHHSLLMHKFPEVAYMEMHLFTLLFSESLPITGNEHDYQSTNGLSRTEQVCEKWGKFCQCNPA